MSNDVLFYVYRSLHISLHISLHELTKHCVRGEIHYEDTSEIVSGDVHGKKYVGDGAQVRMWGEKTCEEASQIFPAVWCPP